MVVLPRQAHQVVVVPAPPEQRGRACRQAVVAPTARQLLGREQRQAATTPRPLYVGITRTRWLTHAHRARVVPGRLGIDAHALGHLLDAQALLEQRARLVMPWARPHVGLALGVVTGPPCVVYLRRGAAELGDNLGSRLAGGKQRLDVGGFNHGRFSR